MDHCIVGLKLVDTGEWLYMHPTMKLPDVTIIPSTIGQGYKWSTVINSEVYGNHTTLEDAYKTRERDPTFLIHHPSLISSYYFVQENLS